MGMAGVSPPSKYKRTYWITEHAVDQLRRRFEKEGTDHRDDRDLGNLIDYRALIAIGEKNYEDIKDEGVDARIVELQDLGLWAMIKPNTNSRKRSSYPLAVVTLLENWQVERSKRSGKWEPERYDDGDVNVGGLSKEQRDTIKKCEVVDPEEVDPQIAEARRVDKLLLDSAAHCRKDLDMPGLSWWVHYSTKEGPAVPEEYSEKEMALKRMAHVFREGKAVPGTLKLSKEVVPEFTA
jgi:hypothetical protein